MAKALKAVLTSSSNGKLIFYYDELPHTGEGVALYENIPDAGFPSDPAPWASQAAAITEVTFHKSCLEWRPTSLNSYFKNLTSLVIADLSNVVTMETTNMDSVFYGDAALTTIAISNYFVLTAVTSGVNMFYNCTQLPHYAAGSVSYTQARSRWDDGYCVRVRQTWAANGPTETITDGEGYVANIMGLLGNDIHGAPVGATGDYYEIVSGRIEPNVYCWVLDGSEPWDDSTWVANNTFIYYNPADTRRLFYSDTYSNQFTGKAYAQE